MGHTSELVAPATRRCSTCGTTKDEDQFHRHGKRGRQSSCKPCQRQTTLEWRLQNPQEWRRHQLKSKGYGITLEEYDALMLEQAGICRICRRTAHQADRSAWLAVDHDHESGKVRGLLCRPCNGMLGMAQDDIDRLLTAVEYLKEHAA